MDKELQREVEQLGDLLYRKLSDDDEISSLIHQIKEKGMTLSIVIEANPKIDELDEMDFTDFDRHFLERLNIRVEDETD